MQGWLIVPLVPVRGFRRPMKTRGQRPALPALNTSTSYVGGELFFCILLHCIFSFLLRLLWLLLCCGCSPESKQTGNSSRSREHSVTQSHKVRITQSPYSPTASLLSQLARALANDCIFPLRTPTGSGYLHTRFRL